MCSPSAAPARKASPRRNSGTPTTRRPDRRNDARGNAEAAGARCGRAIPSTASTRSRRRWSAFVNAAQQLTIITPFLVYPILVMRGVGADAQTIANFVGLSFLAIGVGTLLQAWPGRWTGSGFLLSSSPAAAYSFRSTSWRSRRAGIPLLTGMTLIAGFAEIGLRADRAAFPSVLPAEISGLCILLIGIFVGVLGIRSGFGLDGARQQATVTAARARDQRHYARADDRAQPVGQGRPRMLCAIIGVVCGYVTAVALGAFDPAAMKVLTGAADLRAAALGRRRCRASASISWCPSGGGADLHAARHGRRRDRTEDQRPRLGSSRHDDASARASWRTAPARWWRPCSA